MDCRVIAVAILFALATADYECNYQPNEDVTRVHLSGPRVQKRSATFDQPFRAFVHYDPSFTSALNITAQQRVQAIINKLTDFLQSVVKVRRTPSPILLNRDCNDGRFFLSNDEVRPCFDLCSPTTTCGPAIVPSDHLLRCHQCYMRSSLCNITLTDGAGVSDADYIIYITSVTTNCGGSTLAYAGFCEMEDDFDRPIAGYVNYCPNSITSDRSDDFIFDVTKHEFLHAMGFSTSAYRWFRDENGDPRSPRDEFGYLLQNVASNNTVKTVTYTDWETRNGFVNKTVSLIVTPKVVEEGRRHFNCSTLEGVQLEDQGGAGTGSSHWEKRIVESEGMTGVISTHPKFSRLTYALLEDSGWYKMNYSFAEQLVWGRGDGCGYVAGSCGGYIKSQKLKDESIAPFCDYLNSPSISKYGCTIDRSAISFCNLRDFNAAVIPAEYQYFNSGENFDSNNATLEHLGGSTTIADFCPYQQGFSVGGSCADTSNARSPGISNTAAQTYGIGSRCIEHDSTWRASDGSFFRTTGFPQSGCYQYFCSNSQVNIIVLNQTYTCSSPGQVINVNQMTNGVTYTGTLVCPSCVQICYDDFVNCPEAAALYNQNNATVMQSVTAGTQISTIDSTSFISTMTSSILPSSSTSVLPSSSTMTSSVLPSSSTSVLPSSSTSVLPSSSTSVLPSSSTSVLPSSSTSVLPSSSTSVLPSSSTMTSSVLSSSSTSVLPSSSTSVLPSSSTMTSSVLSSSSTSVLISSSTSVLPSSSTMTSSVLSSSSTSVLLSSSTSVLPSSSTMTSSVLPSNSTITSSSSSSTILDSSTTNSTVFSSSISLSSSSIHITSHPLPANTPSSTTILKPTNTDTLSPNNSGNKNFIALPLIITLTFISLLLNFLYILY